MPLGVKTEVQLMVSFESIVKEVNAVQLFLHERLQGLSEDVAEIRKTEQLIAVGVLFYKMMEVNPDSSQKAYAGYVNEIAQSIRVASDTAPNWTPRKT